MAFLTGHSGAGKSSILKLIALIERPSRGQVYMGNKQNTAGNQGSAPSRIFAVSIGVVFQDHKLLHDRPIADNVALPLIIAGVPTPGDRLSAYVRRSTKWDLLGKETQPATRVVDR